MNLIPFAFGDHLVRVVMRDGEPWFVLADVCRVLEIANSRDAASRLDDDEKGVGIADTLGGPQEMTIISESGLYALIMTSRKPEAKRFRKWVTADVLPTIRKTGSYTAPGALPPQSPRPDVPVDVLRHWTNMVREARILRGPRAAVTLWNASPLADVMALPEFPPGSHAGGPDLDPAGCLDRLLLLPVKAHGCTLIEAAALHWGGDAGGTGPRAACKPLGVVFDPAGWPGYAAVANRAPALSAWFGGTKWAAGWERALLQIEGAQRAPKVFWFGDTGAARAVLLPRAAFHLG